MSAGKILVVDDDPQIRRVMRATLVAHHYEVTEARTGEDALQAIAHEIPNLVLLDMNMPGMGGLETCGTIRTGSDIPVIILSVRNTEKDKVAALDAGADDYGKAHSSHSLLRSETLPFPCRPENHPNAATQMSGLRPHLSASRHFQQLGG